MVERNSSQKDILAPLRSLAGRAAALCDELHRLDGERPPVRIVVAGGFSAGKSAFVNHLLGKDGIAAEGASATTRCCTEYRYGNRMTFQSGERELTQEEYRRQSTAENSRQSFFVTIDSDCLRDGIVLIDTPGVGATDSDDDLATTAIKSADILLWLVNACGGTILRSELDLLKKAVDDRTEVPLALVLTRIDKIRSDRGEGGCDAASKIRMVVENARTLAEEEHLRLVFPPLPFTNKPGNDATSIQSLVKRQDKDLDHLLKESLKAQKALFERQKSTIRNELGKVRAEFYNRQRLLADNLSAQIKSKEQSIEQAEKRRQEELVEKLQRVLRKHVSKLAETIDAGSDLIKSGPINPSESWPDYRACFNKKIWNVVFWTEEVESEAVRVFRTYSDFNGDVKRVLDAVICELGTKMDNVSARVEDACWKEFLRGESAERPARKSCASKLSDHLKWWVDEEDGRRDFLETFQARFSLPKCKWTSHNLAVWRDEVDQLREQQRALLHEECPQYLSPATDKDASVAPETEKPPSIHVLTSLAVEPPPLRVSRFVAAGILVGWAGLHLALAGRWRQVAVSWVLLAGTFGFEPERFPLAPFVLLGTFAWWIGTICIVRTDGRGRPMQTRRISATDAPNTDSGRTPRSDRSRLIYWLLTVTIGFTGLNNRYIRSRREGIVSTALLVSLIVLLLMYAVLGTSPWAPLIALDILAMFLWNLFCILFVTEDGEGKKLHLSF